MSVDKFELIKKLKEQLSKDEFVKLVQTLEEDGDSFLSDLQEGSTPETENFINDFEETLNRIKREFENHQSVFKSIINYNTTFRKFADKLSQLNVGEIKFVLACVLDLEDGDLFVRYWLSNFVDYLHETDLELIKRDERFKRF